MSDPIKLLEALGENEWDVAVLTTYTLWLPFFEEVVLRRLRAAGCLHTILFVDAAQCGRALAASAIPPRAAGLDYALIPVRASETFHPKVALLAGRKRARLIVGSHNLTLSGFGGNFEVTSQLDVRAGDDSDGGALLDAAAWLRSWLRDQPVEIQRLLDPVDDALRTIRRRASSPRVFLGSSPDGPSLWAQLRPLLPTEVSRVTAVGPYYDLDGSFLASLRREFPAAMIQVALDPEVSALASVPSAPTHVIDARALDPVVALSRQTPNGDKKAPSRPLHAKLLWFEGNRDVVVVGSANPTAAAWLRDPSHRNVEAVVCLFGDEARSVAADLALPSIATSPEIDAVAWSKVQERAAEVAIADGAENMAPAAGLAVASGDVVRLLTTSLDASSPRAVLWGRDGAALGVVDVLRIEADFVLRPVCDVTQIAIVVVRTDDGRDRRFVVHLQQMLTQLAESDRRRTLRRSLIAIDGDPKSLGALLRIIEGVIFDTDPPIVTTTPARRGDGESESSGPTEPTELPGTLLVPTASQGTAARPRALQGGDLGLLLDLLLKRMNEGSPTASDGATPEGDDAESDGSQARAPAPPIMSSDEAEEIRRTAAACRGKFSTLQKRLLQQIVVVNADRPLNAIARVAAVLGVMRKYRELEALEPWVRLRETLVPPRDELAVFLEKLLPHFADRDGTLYAKVSTLTPLLPEECAQALGLLAWLGWDVGLDLAAFDSITTITTFRETSQIQAVQKVTRRLVRFVEVLRVVGRDEVARETLRQCVEQTTRGGTLGQAWCAAHLRRGELLDVAMRAPAGAKALAQDPRIGDIVRFGREVHVVMDVFGRNVWIDLPPLTAVKPGVAENAYRMIPADRVQVIDTLA